MRVVEERTMTTPSVVEMRERDEGKALGQDEGFG